MKPEFYFYNCSPEYINSIDPDIHDQIIAVIDQLPKRQTQSEINSDLFWLLTSYDWKYDSILGGTGKAPPVELNLNKSLIEIKKNNNRDLCLTSTTLDTRWHADYAKIFGSKLVQIEAQFGKVEAMFKDFCGFRIGIISYLKNGSRLSFILWYSMLGNMRFMWMIMSIESLLSKQEHHEN
jgi:hypothetical protein